MSSVDKPINDDLQQALDEAMHPKAVASNKYAVPDEVVGRMIGSGLDVMRGAGFRLEESFVALAQIFAWIKISESNAVPDQYSILSVMLNPSMVDDRLKSGEDYLTGSDNDLWQVAFVGLRNRLRPLQSHAIFRVIDHVKHVLSWGIMDYRSVARVLLRDCLTSSDAFTVIPHEVAQLCTELLETSTTDDVYCPFMQSLHLALNASFQGNSVFFETGERDPLVASIAILWGDGLHIRFSDPILTPSFSEQGRLKQFPSCLACGPFGLRRSLPDFDMFGRFDGKTAYSETIDLKHVLAQTRDRAIVVVPSAWLSRTAPADRELKEELLERGWLQAVIALPEGLLNTTGIPINLLVVDKRKPSSNTLFVDARHTDFTQSWKGRRSARNRLINTKVIVDLFQAHQASDLSQLVTFEECRKHEYDLSINHYVLGREEKRLEEKLASRESTPLHKLVLDIVRGQAVKVGSGDVQLEFREVGAVDIDVDGLIIPPEKRVYVDDKEMWNRSFQNQILGPGDIVLAVKGSVGTVGLVSFGDNYKDGWLVPIIRMSDMTEASSMDTSVGNFLERSNWIVGQSYVIIRANAALIDPIVLFMYLRSEIAQQWIKSKATGTTVPLLKQQYLQNLPVLVPTAEEAVKVKERYSSIVNIAGRLEELRQQLDGLLCADWP